MGGLLLLGSLFGVLGLLVPLALVLGLVVLLALRGEPDDGARGFTLYLALATFLGFLTLLISVTAISAAATELVAGDDDETTSFSIGEESDSGFGTDSGFQTDIGPDISTLTSSDGQTHDDKAWTTMIQAFIAALAALVVLWFHWPRLEAIGGRSVPGAAAHTVRQAYCYTLCFVVVVTLLVSASVATFNVVQAIAPGTTGASNRGDPLESFVPLVVLVLGSAVLFRVHWSRVEVPAILRPAPPEAPAA